jgi:hypothetical protein
MRFLSPIAAYRKVAKHQEIEQLASGQPRVLAPGYTVEFVEGDLTDWEREEARKRLQFKNNYINLDGSPYDPVPHASSYDTATIDNPALRKEVEEYLLNHPDFGRPGEFILVEKPKLEAPWPNYDELQIHGQRSAAHVAKRNIETAATTGVPIEHLIAFERDSQNRGGVIAVYEQALAEQNAPEPEEVVVEA